MYNNEEYQTLMQERDQQLEEQELVNQSNYSYEEYRELYEYTYN